MMDSWLIDAYRGFLRYRWELSWVGDVLWYRDVTQNEWIQSAVRRYDACSEHDWFRRYVVERE